MATAKAVKANAKGNKGKGKGKANPKAVEAVEPVPAPSPALEALETWGAVEPEPIPVQVEVVAEPLPVLEPEIVAPRNDNAVSAKLIAHCGAWNVKRADLALYPAPPSETNQRIHYVPIQHGQWIDFLEERVNSLGLTVKDEGYAVTCPEGRNNRGKDAIAASKLFGVWKLGGDGIMVSPDYEIAMGIRSSYDKSLAFALAIGTRVFVCDNLAFNSEVVSWRRHTQNAMRDMPDIVGKMVERLLGFQNTLALEVEALKAWELTDAEADHLIVQGVRAGAVPGKSVTNVIDNWYTPKDAGTGEFAPRTAWSLHNAFTEEAKNRKPWVQWENTVDLSKFFRTQLASNKMIPATV